MFGLPSGTEWFFVLLVVLIVFGAHRLPQAGLRARQAIEDLRELEPVYSRVESSRNEDVLIFAGILLAALVCLLVLVLAQSGWV